MDRHNASEPIDPPLRFRRKPGVCPLCGSRRVASILYGIPAMSPELQRALEEGRIRLGGCCVSDADPAWECADCGAPFYPERDGEQMA